jgi:hypothetical protein
MPEDLRPKFKRLDGRFEPFDPSECITEIIRMIKGTNRIELAHHEFTDANGKVRLVEQRGRFGPGRETRQCVDPFAREIKWVEREGYFLEVYLPEYHEIERSDAGPDEIAIADLLVSNGHALEGAFVRHFKDKRTSPFEKVVEAVTPGEEREWATVKTWVTRVNNAIYKVDPKCRISFSTTIHGRLVAKDTAEK